MGQVHDKRIFYYRFTFNLFTNEYHNYYYYFIPGRYYCNQFSQKPRKNNKFSVYLRLRSKKEKKNTTKRNYYAFANTDFLEFTELEKSTL